jgi:hypothetical protein
MVRHVLLKRQQHGAEFICQRVQPRLPAAGGDDLEAVGDEAARNGRPETGGGASDQSGSGGDAAHTSSMSTLMLLRVALE